MRKQMTILAAAAIVLTATATATATATVSAAAAAGTSAPVRLAIPAPTGPNPIGTTDLYFQEAHRADPWVPAQKREIMASVWYPARDVANYPIAHQMPAGTAKVFDQAAAGSHHVPSGTVDWGATTTDAHVNAPAIGGKHPVILYSPGLGDPRSWDTTLVQELASRGYAVITVDHTHESPAVEFPDGRVVDNSELLQEFQKTHDPIALLKKIMKARLDDTEYVLDHLPPNVRKTLDLHHIGMFGHSGGGFEALQLLHDDPRIKAALDMDGIVGWDENDTGPGLSKLANDGIDKPFVLMGSATNDHYTSTSWAALWKHSHGWHRDIHLSGAEHASYTDAEALIPQIAAQRKLPAAATADIGWIQPQRALLIERTYVTGFFDQWLRGRDTGLFQHDRFDEASLVH